MSQITIILTVLLPTLVSTLNNSRYRNCSVCVTVLPHASRYHHSIAGSELKNNTDNTKRNYVTLNPREQHSTDTSI